MHRHKIQAAERQNNLCAGQNQCKADIKWRKYDKYGTCECSGKRNLSVNTWKTKLLSKHTLCSAAGGSTAYAVRLSTGFSSFQADDSEISGRI
jgi:hypothetical protein